MGVINITPDSFYPGSRAQTRDEILKKANEMQQQGAAIIDVGGESTRPGSEPLAIIQELERVIPAIEAIVAEIDIKVSIDTSHPEVMQSAVGAGASLINDVRAFSVPGAAEQAARLQVPVCVMHMRYHDTASAPVNNPDTDEDIMTVVSDYLRSRISALTEAGVKRENIIIDPGFGGGPFGKSVNQDLNLLHRLHELHVFNLPILVGLSRKSFIGKVLSKPAEERLWASLAVAAIAAYKGATIIRTHDVAETVDVLKITSAIQYGFVSEGE